MATLDGYAPYPIGLTATDTVAAITRAHNLSTELLGYQDYFSQAAMPTTTKAGSIWLDTDTNIVYTSILSGGTLVWMAN